MYYIKPKKDKRSMRAKAWLIAAGACITAVIINMAVTHMIHDTAISLSKNAASVSVNDAVVSVLNENSYEYTDFIDISRGDDGSVCSVSAKSEAVNKFKSEVSREVIDALKRKENTEFSIPLGTLTDIGVLYGRGPEINIKLRFYGDITTSLESSFISVGINQTKHRITCTVSANITVITPSFTERINVKCEYLIAETVIIGDIPDSYTNVNGDDSGIIGQIFDYADIG